MFVFINWLGKMMTFTWGSISLLFYAGVDVEFIMCKAHGLLKLACMYLQVEGLSGMNCCKQELHICCLNNSLALRPLEAGIRPLRLKFSFLTVLYTGSDRRP